MSRMTDFCDLACDVCGNWAPTPETTIAGGRRYMAKRGWVVRRREGKVVDLCPDCKNVPTPEPQEGE